jgi:ABC-type glycerol-3-phosphate transport system permease component
MREAKPIKSRTAVTEDATMIHRFRLTWGIGAVLKQVTMWIVLLVTLFPLYFMISSALKTRSQFIENPLGLPPLDLTNFLEAFRGKPIATWALNSAIVTGLSVIMVTILATLAAYAFSRMQFRGRDLLFNLIVPLMVIPPVVMLIPLFASLAAVHLINTYWSVVIIYTGLLLPFTVYLLRNFMIKIPIEITDAALIDGCNEFQTLVYILVPLTRPALITSIVVNTLWVWNELLVSLVFLQTEEMRTLMVGIITFKERFTLNVPVIMAGLAIATIPMLVIYLVGQQYFSRGLVTGAVK